MALKDFISQKKQELKILKRDMPLNELKKKIKNQKPRDFLSAFKNGFAIIAEIKKASPSEGIIDTNADIVEIARQYETGGAQIISVLTDKKFFYGNINFIPKIKSAVSLPILRKDFIIDAYQIYESKAYGADAILLIAKALTEKKLEKFIDLAHKLGLECLVEVHDKEDLNKILKLSDKIKVIGINNRNLNTLKTDLLVIGNLMPKIPKDKIVISESGIKDRKDVERIRKLGVNGILTGTSLMKAENKVLAVKSFLT